MARNTELIPSKTTGLPYAASEFEVLRGFVDSPEQSLGTFNPSMTFDGTGAYSDYTLTTNITITATGIVNGNERFVKIIGNASNTVAVGSGGLLIRGNVGTLPGGNNYFYMKAFAGVVHISVINPTQSQLSTPANFTATSGQDSRIPLSWDSVTGATGYTLQQSTDQTNWSNVSGYGGTATNYTVTSLTNNTLYYFRVQATASGYSPSAWVQTSATPAAAGWTPALLGSKLILWLDGADESSFTKDVSENVEEWRDLSGNSNHFGQTTGANQPVWDGTDQVDFNGTDQWLVCDNNIGLNDEQGEVIFVGEGALNKNGPGLIFQDTVNNKFNISPGYRVADDSVAAQVRGELVIQVSGSLVGNDDTISSATTYISFAGSNGSAYYMYVNGVQKTIVVQSGSDNGDWNAEITAQDEVSIGRLNRSTTDVYYGGGVKAILYVDTPLTTTERTNLYSWLINQYGL